MKRGAVQANFKVGTPLVALTANEAARIAKTFVTFLMANRTAESAVDRYCAPYPSLRELDRECSWFRPMMEAIAVELRSEVTIGVKLRACIGAILSITDMISDSIIIEEYFRTGRGTYARLLVAMISFNVCLQIANSALQTSGLKKNRLREFLFELATVLTFTKPGWDAYFYVSGAEQKPGARFSPFTMMATTKGGELFAEAIPGA
jgi:hypothetical protein